MGYQAVAPKTSPSSRRAWIEIRKTRKRASQPSVALLAEGVDRNRPARGSKSPPKVALLAEGVDRNLEVRLFWVFELGSPSSRRAWIEMIWATSLMCQKRVALLAEGVDRNGRIVAPAHGCFVALLAEGVDRNRQTAPQCIPCGRSPSSRRAWIEIRRFGADGVSWGVALLAEGVDRNKCRPPPIRQAVRRPPRGGRG